MRKTIKKKLGKTSTTSKKKLAKNRTTAKKAEVKTKVEGRIPSKLKKQIRKKSQSVDTVAFKLE